MGIFEDTRFKTRTTTQTIGAITEAVQNAINSAGARGITTGEISDLIGFTHAQVWKRASDLVSTGCANRTEKTRFWQTTGTYQKILTSTRITQATGTSPTTRRTPTPRKTTTRRVPTPRAQTQTQTQDPFITGITGTIFVVMTRSLIKNFDWTAQGGFLDEQLAINHGTRYIRENRHTQFKTMAVVINPTR